MNCIVYLARKERWHVIKIRALMMIHHYVQYKAWRINTLQTTHNTENVYLLKLLNSFWKHEMRQRRKSSSHMLQGLFWDKWPSILYPMKPRTPALNDGWDYAHVLWDPLRSNSKGFWQWYLISNIRNLLKNTVHSYFSRIKTEIVDIGGWLNCTVTIINSLHFLQLK